MFSKLLCRDQPRSILYQKTCCSQSQDSTWGQKLNDALQDLFICCSSVCVCVPVCMCVHEYVVNTEILEKERSKFTTVQVQTSCIWVHSSLASQWFLSKLELERRAGIGLLKSLLQER